MHMKILHVYGHDSLAMCNSVHLRPSWFFIQIKWIPLYCGTVGKDNLLGLDPCFSINTNIRFVSNLTIRMLQFNLAKVVMYGNPWSLVQRSELRITDFIIGIMAALLCWPHRNTKSTWLTDLEFITNSLLVFPSVMFRCFPIYPNKQELNCGRDWKCGVSVQSSNTIAGVHCLEREMLPAGLVSAQTKNGRPSGCYTHDTGKPWQQQRKMTACREQASVMLSSSSGGWNPVCLFISFSTWIVYIVYNII